MSKETFKTAYKCDCGIDYGSCGRDNEFVFQYNSTVDVGRLTHIVHKGDESEIIIDVGAFTDNALAALIKVLTKQNK